MKFKIVSQLTLIGILFCFCSAEANPVLAQQELCRETGRNAPAKTSRTLELPQFGIDIDIPKNYRAMSLKNGSVGILDPDQFEILSCTARGGKVLGAHGWYLFSIRKIENFKKAGLLDVVKQSEQSQYTNYNKYNLDGTMAIITSTGSSASAWFIPPNTQKIVIMTVSCDCRIGPEDIIKELNKTRLR
jgi:hypothetical protein